MPALPGDPGSRMPIYDIVAVGFGPSNLALAIALEEHNSQVPPGERLSLLVLERKEEFGWHQGMLLEGTTMQVSFLKDLATMRNPASKYTFLSYLHENSRLADFINHRTMYPSRIEFHDYLTWAAEKFTESVRFGVAVTNVLPVHEGEGIGSLDVVGKNVRPPPAESVFRARNLVIGTGLAPRLPPGVEQTSRVCHSAGLLDHIAGWNGARRFAIVGAGQSAAETASYLHSRFPEAEVHAVFSRYGYSPADDSPFANRVFDPEAVDEFFTAPASVKEKFYAYHANTNYSVVDTELIQQLYSRMYEERVRGAPRLHVHHLSTVVGVAPRAQAVTLRVKSLALDRVWDLDVDAAVFATGYHPMDPAAVLGDAAMLCKRSGSGRFRAARNYRVSTVENVRCGIFLQGGTEHTHGLTSSLLSNIAIRAGEILSTVHEKERGCVRS
jgi:L-ornithine N5-monooxygenase